ncbi:MAG: helix-turn-helix domain-containing protein [Streptosporangiaceae bacterium]
MAPLRVQVTHLEVVLYQVRGRLALMEQAEETLKVLLADAMATEAVTGTDGTAPGPGDAEEAPPRKQGRPGAAPTRCDLIVRIMATDRSRARHPKDVAREMGEDASLESVRSLMKYMTKTGRLVKTAASMYRLADSEQSPASSQTATGGEDPAANVTYPLFGAVRDPSRQTTLIDRPQVLAFLHEHSARRWRPTEIADQLGILDREALMNLLKDMAADGLLARRPSGRFQYVTTAAFSEKAV